MFARQPEILLIEDSEYDAELTFKALHVKLPSVQYIHMRNGMDALNYLFGKEEYEQENYRLPLLILLDLDMPQINGFQVLEQLKTHVSTKAIPIVVFTVSTSDENMQKAYMLGANSYIIKPMNFVKFSLTIAEIVHYWLVVNDLPNRVK